MAGPFPGMDPYLEALPLWRDLHHSFITYARAALRAVMPPGYLARVEERVYSVPGDRDIVPDVFVRRHPNAPAVPSVGSAAVLEREDTPHIIRVAPTPEREYYISIVDAKDRERVITSIEVLSPTNKAMGHPGRAQYVRKQEALLNSVTHLLEIDLLRSGQHTLAVPLAALHAKAVPWDYLICLHRAEQNRAAREAGEEEFEIWFNRLRQPLPRVRVPLDMEREDVTLDLQAVLNRCYDEADYGGELDYAAEPTPPLRPEDALWADSRLRERGARS